MGLIDSKNFKYTWIALSFLLLVSACQKDDPSPANNTDTYVNDWIFDNMSFWYLWNDNLPSSPDKTKDPEAFFASLLNTPQDRFSWIQDNYIELLNSLQGVSKEAGFEFVLYKESETSDNVIAQVEYIKPNSPVAGTALKRGDIITKINDQQITTSNFEMLLDALHANFTVKYKPLIIDEKKFGGEQSLSLNVVEYSEDPNFLSKVIESNGRKIGYYVYNFFASGIDGDTVRYDKEMDNVFNNFKTQGITDLVIDLRFNSGGSEVAAKNLASLIAPSIDNTNVFFKRQYNSKVEDEIRNGASSDDFLVSKFSDKSDNIGSYLTDSRVYILTGSRTASASELIINALKPYMDVYLIGATTYGKNVGSISIYEENDSKNKWGMQPIVVKAYNSLDQSDYSSGFVPDIENKDNSVMLYPLGDERENLLSLAIAQITGVSLPGRIASRQELKDEIGHSLDYKKRSYQLTLDKRVNKIFQDR
jgi:C-terminal processing protease CtpA/Prc